MAPKGGLMILVVDDDDDSRSSIREVLEDGGYDVLEACDGQDALELLSKRGDAVGTVILDLRMPRLSGWDLLEILRSDPAFSRVRVLVTSGISVHGDASGIGATMSWIRKPFGSTELLRAVETCVVAARSPDRFTETHASVSR